MWNAPADGLAPANRKPTCEWTAAAVHLWRYPSGPSQCESGGENLSAYHKAGDAVTGA